MKKILLLLFPLFFFASCTTGVAIVDGESFENVSINIRDQTSRPVDLFFGHLETFSTLSAQANPDDTTLTIANTTGFIDGRTVGVFSADDPDIFYLGVQIGPPVGNVITLDTPVDQELQINSSAAAVTTNMAVDGSTTTQIFQIGPVGPGSDQVIDLTRIMGTMMDPTAMDEGTFGGIPALTRGIVLRKNNGVKINLWNIKTNGGFGLHMFDTAYTPKTGGGEFGFGFRNSYAGQENYGVALRLEPGDTLEILIQDDLTGLSDFRMLAQGHVVEIELN